MYIVRSLFVEKPIQGRRYAISDVHGCSKTFKKLLKKINLKKNDQLFLIGDMINRGPRSHKVLNTILKLKKKGYKVYFIRGNHEQMTLNSSNKRTGQRKRQIRSLNSAQLLEEGKLHPIYNSLLQDSLHFIKTEDYLLVHAGFNHYLNEPFEDSYSMMNIREFKLKNRFTKGKSIVIGHTPKTFSYIKKRITKGRKKIYIDNGCVNHKLKGQGRLICFDLDSKAIICQKNIDI